jgi:hypothetical protein
VSEARLKRYEKWVSAAALFVALQVTTNLQVDHGVHGGVGFYIALLAPFGAGLLVVQWLRSRARAQVPPGDWRVLGWLNSALLLREGWWNSPVQIERAWLISGVAIGAVAFGVYRGDLGTAAFVGITFPGIVLVSSVRHFRHPPECESQPVHG